MSAAVAAWVTVDVTRDIALVRGREADRIVRLTVPAEHIHWSRVGRGHVIPARYVPDITAYAQLRHLLVVVSRRKGAEA